MDCYITIAPSGKASRVLTNNGKESELFTSLLSVPFIENGAESIDLYGKLISLDFLKEKHIQDDNGEPKLYFMAGNSNVNPLFESFANAKAAYPNSPIIAGFAKHGKLQEYNNRSYAPMNQFTPIASFANILSDGTSKNDIINNLIVTGAVKGKMSWGMKLRDKVKSYLDFQVIGEKGAKNVDLANNNDNLMSRYERAIKMEKELGISESDWMTTGAKREEKLKIRLETGWDKDAGNQWAYEVEDFTIKDGKTQAIIDAYNSKQELDYKVSDLFDTPIEIEQAHPTIKDLTIKFITDYGNIDTEGYIKGNTIYINRAKYEDFINGRKGKSGKRDVVSKRLLNLLNHEIAHSIQQKEGFFEGGNANRFNLEYIFDETGGINAIDRDNVYKLAEKMESLPKDERRDFIVRDIDSNLKTLFILLNKSSNAKLYLDTVFDNSLSDYEKYERLAGEVNARNIGSIISTTRGELSKEERAYTLLEDTEDVNRQDVIRLNFTYPTPQEYKTSSPTSNTAKAVTEYLKSKGFPLNILSEQQMIEEARKLGYENFSEVPDTLIKGERIYGFYNPQNNQIYLTEEVMNSDTLTHELWHFYRPILVNQAASGNKTAEALLKRFDELALTVLGGEDKLKEYFDGASKSSNVQVDFEMQKAAEEASSVPLVKDNNGNLLAPNGKISNLNETQWKIVRTAAFKSWFGDWMSDSENASKVVDSNGEPKPLYHETNAEWFEYDKAKAKAGKFDSSTPNGIFLKSSDKNIGIGSKQMNLFSSIKNPIYARNRELLEDFFMLNIKEYAEIKDKLARTDREYGKKIAEENKKISDILGKERENFKGEIPSPEWKEIVDKAGEEANKIIDDWGIETDNLSLAAKKLIDNYISDSEYDGVLLLSDKGSWGRETDAIIAVNPNQIKLADGSNVTFGETSDIRFKIENLQNNINFAKITDKLKNNGLQRLSKESEQGRSESGEINAISTIISAAVQRNVQEKYGVSNANAISETKRLETNALEQYANDNGLIVSLSNSEVIGGGNESDIYEHSNPNLITKVTFPNNYNSWLEMFDSIAIHNAENPTTQIKINGFATNKDGELSIVTEQNLIQGTPPQFKTIHEDLISKGYELSGEYGDGRYIHREKGIVLEDVKEDNVLEDSQGNLHYIDTDFYPYDKQRGGNVVLSELPDIRFKTESNDNTTGTFGETRANSQGETSINNKEGVYEDMAQNGKERLFDNTKSENTESQGVYNVVSPLFSSEVYAPRQNETFDAYKDRIMEEAIARLLGENSIDYFERIAKEAGLNDKETKSFVEKVKQFILDFADWLGKQLGLTDITPEQLSKMTNKEMFDAVITSMISGDYIGENFDNISSYNDIRFSIIGERAASNVENYKKSLEEAKSMEENGASPIEIESKTKWYKYQGQWRTLSNEAIRAFKDIKLPEINKKTNLKTILGNENVLLKMYPSLGEYGVILVSEGNKNVPQKVKNALKYSSGIFNEEESLIYINSQNELQSPAVARDIKHTLIHEVQHIIQKEEKMPVGGNLKTISEKAFKLMGIKGEITQEDLKVAIDNRDKAKFSDNDNNLLDRAVLNIEARVANNIGRLVGDYESLMGEIDANIASEALNSLYFVGDNFEMIYSKYLNDYLYLKNITEKDIISIYDSAIQANIIGEVGASSLNDSLQTMDNLVIAKEMLAKNKSPKAIKNATGWEYSAPENKWKLELDYGTTKNLPELRELAINSSFNRKYVTNVVYKIGKDGKYDVRMYNTESGGGSEGRNIEYRELSKDDLLTMLGAELTKDILDEKGYDMTDSWEILYDSPAEKAFEINKKYPMSTGNAIKLSSIFVAPELFKAFPELKNLDVVVSPLKSGEAAWDGENIILTPQSAIKNDKYIRSILIHEVQHFIQEQEGFARGGTSMEMQTEFTYEDEFILGEYADSEKSASEFLADPNVKYLLLESPEIRSIIENKTKLEVKLTLKDAKLTASEKYKRLAGEVEARNVQARAEMSKAKRLKTLLSETEDIAPEDKIYLYGSTMASSESPLKDKIIAKRKELAKAELRKQKFEANVAKNTTQQLDMFAPNTEQGGLFEIDKSQIQKDYQAIKSDVVRISSELNALINESQGVKVAPNQLDLFAPLNLDTTVKQDIEFKIATNPKYIVDALIQGGYVEQDCSL